MKLEYQKNGDYYIPNLALNEQRQTPLDALYNSLLLFEKLYSHLLKIDQRLGYLIPRMAKATEITTQLETTDQRMCIF